MSRIQDEDGEKRNKALNFPGFLTTTAMIQLVRSLL